MAIDFKTILESLLPKGAAWLAKSGSDLDNLLEGVGSSFSSLRDDLETLSNIRDPDNTPILADLEHEYGVIPDIGLTEAERRETLRGIVFAKPGMGVDHMTAELHKAGFTNLFAYQNDPLTNPEFYTDGTWSAWCGGEDSFCGGEEAYCGYASGGGGYVLVNDNAADATTDVPNDPTIWHLVFFVGGTKTDATAGYFLLVDGDMEAATTAAWSSGPGSDTTLTKETSVVYEGTQSLKVELTDHSSVADPESFYGEQDVGVDSLDEDLFSAPLMHDDGAAVLYDSGFVWSDKSRNNGENGDALNALGYGVKAGGTNASDKLAIDFLDAQLAQFEGVLEDNGGFATWAKVNDASRVPTFDFVPGEAVGYGDLPQDLTINGTTVSPAFRYEAQNADLTSWVATVGDDLPIAGAGADPTFDELAPGPEDERVKFNAGDHFEAALATFAKPGTDDIAIEWIWQHIDETTTFASKYTSAADRIEIANANTSVAQILLNGTTISSGTLIDGAWYHALAFLDRSGSGVMYCNGVEGTAVSISALSALEFGSLAKWALGAKSGGTTQTNSSLAFLSMWHSPAWLDSHLQPELAQERASIAMGIYPQIAQDVDSTTLSIPVTTSGYAALDEDITINSVTKSPTFRYEADQADATNWLATVGDDLAIAGSGTSPVIDEYAPGLTDKRVKFDLGEYYGAASASYAQTGTDDLVIELVWKHTSTVGYLLSRYVSTVDRIAVFTGGAFLQISLNGTGITVSGNVEGEWNHAFIVLDRSGSGVIYANGSAGTPVSISALSASNFGSAAKWAVGAKDGGATPTDGSVSYCSMWQGAAWLDTHLQADVAKERFYKACGVWPELAAEGLYAPEVASRSTVAYIDKLDSNGDIVQVPVGANWVRACEREDLAAATLSGYLPETQATNLVLTSEGGTGWALVDAGDTVNLAAAVAPDGETTALELIADSTDGQHGYSHGSLTLTAASYTASTWAKLGDVNFVKLECSTIANAYAYFDIGNGTVETEGAAAVGRITGPHIGDYYRCEITFTGTAAVHTFRALSCAVDDDDTIIGDGATTNTYLWGLQVELADWAGSRIETTGSSATRVKDQFQVHAGMNIGGEDHGRGRLSCSVLIPNGDNTVTNGMLATISDGGSNNDRILCYGDLTTGDKARLWVRESASTQADVNGTSDISDGNIHTIDYLFEENNFKLLVDGASEGTPDTSGTPPDGLDQIDIGMSNAAGNQPNGLIGGIKFYSTTEGTVPGYLPKTVSRSSSALVEKVLSNGTETALISVGANWMRVDKAFDVDLATVQGYHPESIITNRVLYSEDFSNAAWTQTNLTGVTADAVTALGEQSFDAIVGDATAGIHAVTQAAVIPTIGVYAVSAYVKAGDKDVWYCDVSEVANGYCYFDLDSSTYSAGAGVENAYIENKGDGVFRIVMAVSVPGATATARFAPADAFADYTFSGDAVTVNGYIFGAQVERSNGDLYVATSYQITEAAIATRTADILTMHGGENVGGEDFDVAAIRAEYMHAIDLSGAAGEAHLVNIGNGSALNGLKILSNISAIVARVDSDGTNQALLNGSWSSSTNEKEVYELGAKLDDFRAFIARKEDSNDTSGNMPVGSLACLDIGQRYDSTLQFNGLIPRITISPYGLANPRGIMGNIDPATGLGQFIAYDDKFDGTFELLGSVDVDGLVQFQTAAEVMPTEGEWFHVGIAWRYASGSIFANLYVNGVEVGDYFVTTADPSVTGNVAFTLGAVAIKNALAGGAVSIAKPKSFIAEIVIA